MQMSFTIGDAIAIAANWITTSGLPLQSALIGGSVAYANPVAAYDPASDIDCYLVVAGTPPEGKIGKITVDGVLLDISWIPWKQLAEAENHAVLASLVHFGKIVVDTDSSLTTLKHHIDSEFGSPDAIARRLEDMRARVRGGLASDSSHLQQPEQVMNWLFPATLATHIPLVIACAPLTVRKRFLAAKRVMTPDLYEPLLALYGFDTVTLAQAQTWLDDTATLFDRAAAIAERSARFWATDIQADARPIAIGGSQRLIDAGLHREALYWIIATQTRCLTVMNDAGADTSAFLPTFNEMTASHRIATAKQRASRSANIFAWIDAYQIVS